MNMLISTLSLYLWLHPNAGIGRATVLALVKCGAEVIALSRTEEDLQSLKKEASHKYRAVRPYKWTTVFLEVLNASNTPRT